MFADETHYSRDFVCGWSARPESALSIARRVQRMTRELGRMDPRFTFLWPQFAARAIRPTDPGPVLDLSDETFGDLIDRKARFDPPPFPAPVDPWGYSLALGGTPTSELRDYGANVYAGRWREPPFDNSVDLEIDQHHEIWRHRDQAVQVLGILIEVWQPDWGYAAGRPSDGACGDTYGRPLMTWSAEKGLAVPRAFLDVGPPLEIRDYLGGELQIWP